MRSTLASKLDTAAPFEDTTMLRKQLVREINCLELQLERLRHRDVGVDLVTLQTYEEMISARRNMLDGL